MSRDHLHRVPPMRDDDVAVVVAALTAAPADAELAGEESAVAMFRAVQGRPARRSLRMVVRTSVGAGVVAGVLSTGVVTAAAYTSHLPDPVQRVAHHLLRHVGVPAPRPKPPEKRHGSPPVPVVHQGTVVLTPGTAGVRVHRVAAAPTRHAEARRAHVETSASPASPTPSPSSTPHLITTPRQPTHPVSPQPTASPSPSR